MSTPAIPPNDKDARKPMNQYMGEANVTFPLYIVIIQLKIWTPIGMAMIMVMMPKKAFTSAPAPMVKKWCSQTR